MGDRWTISILCSKCRKMNEEIYYAESSEATSFTCEFCGVGNDIIQTFVAVPQKPPKGKKVLKAK